MFAIHHYAVLALKEGGNSSVDKIVPIVVSKASKEGISISARKATTAVQNVMTLLKKGQKDKNGVFKEASKCREVSCLEKPGFFTNFESYVESRNSENAVIVNVSCFDLKHCFRADLLLKSRDFNACDFSLQLANCLTKDVTTIYMECSNLNNRGLKRLLGIIKDVKGLFDNRVRIIMVTGSTIKAELSKLSEHDLSSFEPVNKKSRVEEKKDSEDTSDIELKTSEISQFEVNIEKYETLVNVEKSPKKLISISEYKVILESKSQELEELNSELEDLKQVKALEVSSLTNKMLESDQLIEKLNSTVHSLQIENDSLEKENNALKKVKDTVSLENKSLLLAVGEDNKNINILQIERDNLRVENENLKKEAVNLKLDNDKLKFDGDELKSKTLKLDEEDKKKGKNSDLKKLKEAILNNQQNLKNCLSPEIVKKSVSKLHFKAVPSRNNDGLVVFSVTIIKGDIVENYEHLLVFEGLGINTKMAKINAFDNFIENVLKYDS